MVEYCVVEEKHLPQIMEFYKKIFPDEELIGIDEMKETWHTIKRNGINYFVAIDEDKIISLCYLAIIPNLMRNDNNGVIGNVLTAKEYKGKGIASGIIKKTLNYGRKRKCNKIIMESNYSNREVHIFYGEKGKEKNVKKKRY